MTADLSTPTHLRALVEGLDECTRRPWVYEDGDDFVRTGDGTAVVSVVSDEEGRYFAAFGPPVVLALADLLDEIAKHDQADDPHDWETCFIAVRHAADALEAAIHRTPEGAA